MELKGGEYQYLMITVPSQALYKKIVKQYQIIAI